MWDNRGHDSAFSVCQKFGKRLQAGEERDFYYLPIIQQALGGSGDGFGYGKTHQTPICGK